MAVLAIAALSAVAANALSSGPAATTYSACLGDGLLYNVVANAKAPLRCFGHDPTITFNATGP
ncbi:MAG: hypothetical protein ABSD82_13250, partial [Solirubrobacteraceae bacterium]